MSDKSVHDAKSISKTQELNQQVGHRYGWCVEFSHLEQQCDQQESLESSGRQHRQRWVCTVWVGVYDKRRFLTDEYYPNTVEGRKAGQIDAATLALDGLQHEIQQQQLKSVKELHQVFTNKIPIYESNRTNWNYFWQNRPSVVGIDVEGNQLSPPVLVQIAVDDYVILETPAGRGGLSKDLEKLLHDNQIMKVFCDNNSHRDKKCLGISIPTPDVLMSTGPIVDVEILARPHLGSVKVPRGISKLVVLTMPELNVRIEKPKSSKTKIGRFKDVFRFSMIEQGKAPPLRSISELSVHEQQYAALDAWCTLQVYNRLLSIDTS